MTTSAALKRPAYLASKAKAKKQVTCVDQYLEWKRANHDTIQFEKIVELARSTATKIQWGKPYKHPIKLVGYEKDLYQEVLNAYADMNQHNKTIETMIEQTEDYYEQRELDALTYYFCQPYTL